MRFKLLIKPVNKIEYIHSISYQFYFLFSSALSISEPTLLPVKPPITPPIIVPGIVPAIAPKGPNAIPIPAPILAPKAAPAAAPPTVPQLLFFFPYFHSYKKVFLFFAQTPTELVPNKPFFL